MPGPWTPVSLQDAARVLPQRPVEQGQAQPRLVGDAGLHAWQPGAGRPVRSLVVPRRAAVRRLSLRQQAAFDLDDDGSGMFGRLGFICGVLAGGPLEALCCEGRAFLGGPAFYLPHLRELTIGATHTTHCALPVAFSTLTQLTSLAVKDRRSGGGTTLSWPPGCLPRSLRSLEVEGCLAAPNYQRNATSHVAAAASGLTALDCLHLSGSRTFANGHRPVGLEGLERFTSLTRLAIDDVHAPLALRPVPALTALRHLTLAFTH